MQFPDSQVIKPLAGLPSLPPPPRLDGLNGDVARFADSLAAANRRLEAPPAESSTPLRQVAPAAIPFTQLEESLDPAERQRIDDTAKQLEAVFLRQIMSRMRGSFGSIGGALGKDPQAQFYDDFAWSSFADGMAGGQQGGIGLGAMIYEDLIRDEAGKLLAPPA